MQKTKTMEHPLRDHAREKLCEVFPGKPIKVRNAEIGVYNWAIKNTVGKRLGRDLEQPSWENRLFRQRYKQRLLSIVFNLKKNPDMARRIKGQDLENLTPGQMWPDGPLGVTERKLKERETAIELAKAKMDAEYEGILKCPKCKSNKTSYFQMQTRSADEPMTTYAECLCGNKWKF